MTSFVSLPQLAPDQLTTPQMSLIDAVRQNMAILIGDTDGGSGMAITRDSITVEPVSSLELTALSASGWGYVINTTSGNQQIAALEDVRNLIYDVQKLANDVSTLYNTLNALITQMKG